METATRGKPAAPAEIDARFRSPRKQSTLCRIEGDCGYRQTRQIHPKPGPFNGKRVRLRNDAIGILKRVAGIPIRIMENLGLSFPRATSLNRAVDFKVRIVTRIHESDDQLLLCS